MSIFWKVHQMLLPPRGISMTRGLFQQRAKRKPDSILPFSVPSFPNAKPGKDEAQNVFNIGGSGQRVQRSQCFVEVEQEHLVVHPLSSRLATPLQGPKRFPKKLLVSQVGDQFAFRLGRVPGPCRPQYTVA